MKRKRRLIEAGVLLGIFFLAVVFFSYLTNKDNNNMTADMGAPTLPQLSFSYNGYNLNLLSGYVNEMDMLSMRETITPVVNNRMTVLFNDYGNVITKLEYHVYTLDGEKELKTESIDAPAQNNVLTLDERNLLEEERNLRLDVTLESGKVVYYYTRIKDAEDTELLSNLDYIDLFFRTEMKKATDEAFSLGDDLEPNAFADAYTYQHVDITSDRSYVTWGDLEPEVLGGIRYEIKEMNDIYTSVLMKYQVRCKGEENETDTYDVQEFFRVRTLSGQTYLLDYDRETTQQFTYSNKILDEKGILLGITSSELNYDVNSSGNIVNFVQDGELWNYDKKSDKLALLFSFSEGESSDSRNLNTEHDIQILNTDDSGNTTFAVYGYMNRGEHEGEVGAAVYYFDKSKNTIEEKVFVTSNLSAERAVEELKSMLYYSLEGQNLYAMADGTLYRYSIFFETTDEVIKNLSKDQYAVSQNGRWIAYQNLEKKNQRIAESITVLDLETEEERTIQAGEGEGIWPLGFVADDVVYGVAAADEISSTEEGSSVPMYKAVIESPSGDILKTYQENGIFISSAEFNDKMISLNRVAKHGKAFTTIASDYIMNNQEKKSSNIKAEEYYGEKKLTQMRLTFENGISDQNPKILKPKHVLYESAATLPFGILETDAGDNRFYVYGIGKMQGSFGSEGAAIRAAAKCNGVVLSAGQKYVWESGNRDLKYYIDNSELITRICNGLRSGKTPDKVISNLNNGTYKDLTGCKAEDLLYIINNDGPVIAMTSPAEYVILIGYGDDNINYIDVAENKDEEDVEKEVEITELDVLTNSYGNVYFGF